MQIDETVHGCPVAVVHLIVRLEVLALQVKSGPPRGNRLWLRPQAALCKERMKLTVETNLERIAAKCCEPPVEERGAGKPHATFCGNRGWGTAPGAPVGGESLPYPYPFRN